MKYVEDLEDVMHETGITDYAELQKMGYDVLSYLKRKQSRLLSKIEDLQNIIDDCSLVENGISEKQSPLLSPFKSVSTDDADDLPF